MELGGHGKEVKKRDSQQTERLRPEAIEVAVRLEKILQGSSPIQVLISPETIGVIPQGQLPTEVIKFSHHSVNATTAHNYNVTITSARKIITSTTGLLDLNLTS